MVVLYDTEWNTYTMVTVVDRFREEANRNTSVDAMFAKLVSGSQLRDCAADSDCVSLDYKFVQQPLTTKPSYSIGEDRGNKTIRTFSANEWRRFIIAKKKEFECARDLAKDGNSLSAMSPFGGPAARFGLSDARLTSVHKKAVPYFSIEYYWNLPLNNNNL
jgi:hypothetical protein